jgi:carboxypeptidase C (cathepsin A)
VGVAAFVGGESYGTTRAAGLSGYLTDHDMPINGVMLLSAIIDVNANAGEQRQLMTLPTEIMTAHYPQEAAARSAEIIGGADCAAGARTCFGRVSGVSLRRRARDGSAARRRC